MIKRDSDGIAHIVGLSGGKDSTALALALAEFDPKPYNYMYTPTGDELPEMVQHLANLESILGSEIIKISNGTLASQTKERESFSLTYSRGGVLLRLNSSLPLNFIRIMLRLSAMWGFDLTKMTARACEIRATFSGSLLKIGGGENQTCGRTLS